MSAIGPKRTSLVAPHMSAFGGKADMTILVWHHDRDDRSGDAIRNIHRVHTCRKRRQHIEFADQISEDDRSIAGHR
jgi:hypothetical protein